MGATRGAAMMWTGSGRVAAVLLLVAAGYALMLAAMQRQMIYYPERASDAALLAAAPALGLAPWVDAAGARIGWRRATPTPGAPRLVVFHGNAGHALHRHYFVDGFPRWNSYLFEYPGYGARSGEPGEAAIKAAALAALDELLAAENEPVVLLGESLGAGVACHLAARRAGAVAGLVLVTPFTRLSDVAAHHFPWLPVSLLLRERWDCVRELEAYRGPAAFLLAGRDEVVPTPLGRRLYEGFGGRKLLQVEPGAQHNTIDYDPRRPWWSRFVRFLLEEAPP